MPEYRYRALNTHGRVQNGTLTAQSVHDLQLRLIQAGMQLIETKPAISRSWKTCFQRKSLRDLAQFCQHMGQLERASVRLTDSLNDVAWSLPESSLRHNLLQVTREVETGSSLSHALTQRPSEFPPPMPALIAAGEASGQLGISFIQLADHYDWQAKIRSRLVRVLAYPLFALCAMICVILFLLAYVIPETAQFLSTMNVTLPAHSRILMNIALFTAKNGIWMLAATGTAIFGFAVLYRRSASFADKVDRWLLKIPLFGSLLLKIDLARFSKTLSMLLASGIDLPPAMETASGAARNRAIVDSLTIMRKQIDSGNPLSFAIQLSGLFPALVRRIIMAGEEAGTLVQSLQNVADYYEQDVQNSAENIVNAIGPIITLITGSLLIWLVLAIFIPIYDVLPQLV